MQEIELLKRRLDRERRARQQAEAILEQKALELYRTNQELKQLNEELEYKIAARTVELRRSEDKYRGIIENMELGLLEVDNNHVIQHAYDWFCDMTGYTAEELVGRNAQEVFLADDAFKPVMANEENKRKQGQAGVYEVQIKNKAGELMWVLISGAPIYNLEGEVTGSIGIHYDLTERKRLEQQLLEAKRVAEAAQEAEKQFLAKMSHEIRTPLNAIIGMAHLLYDTKPTEEQREFLSILRSSSNILQSLISDILDFSKIQAGEIQVHAQEFDLIGLVKSLQKTFQLKLKEQPIEVVAQIDPRLNNLVVGDKLLLNQILMNLMGNAAKFTHQGAIGIVIEVQNETEQAVELLFKVFDTGIGIPPEKQDLIFQDFKQADENTRHRYGGTGLGLAIVRDLVELQKGQIHVISAEGTGTTFKFKLTYPKGSSNIDIIPERNILSESLANLSQCGILVAEDNYMNRKYISNLLQKWQLPFQMAVNGREAVEMASMQKFDLVFMDISMPEMNGYEATISIRNTKNPNQETPIIALTASALLSKKDEALEIGMTEYLSKPFQPRTLLKVIQRYLKTDAVIENSSQLIPFATGLDRDYLAEFYQDDYEYAADMFATFLDYTVKEFPKIQSFFLEKDYAATQKLVHKLKPTFAMVGLTDLEHSLTILEKDLEEQPAQVALVDLQSIENQLTKSVPILQDTLRKLEEIATV
ncbi:MAG: response regulator [Saprospiraceae bacterium]